MNQEQEDAFVRAFIVPEKRERYRQLLADPKRRKRLLGALYHTLDAIPARMFPIASRDHSTETVVRLLTQKGAGLTCCLISPERDIDRREVPLREAVHTLITQDGVAVACCLPGRLAYYKAEQAQYILEHIPP